MISSFFADKKSDKSSLFFEDENINIIIPDEDNGGSNLHGSSSSSSAKSRKGLITSTLFAAAYFIRPIHMSIPILMIFYGNFLIIRLVGCLLTSVILISFFTPPRPMPYLVEHLLSPILDYFQYDEIIENSPVHIQESIVDGRQYIFACQPHGIVPFCSIAWSIKQAQNKRKVIPTAVASLVLWTPLLKHIMGMFGGVTAATMRKQLQTKQVPCVRLYVGSTTEIFFCSEKTEVLYLSKRKKFIKLALQMGVDVIPVYMFGNTSVYSAMKNIIFIKLSDWFQFPCTYVWGRYGLPIPRKEKLLYVSGQPLGLPHIKRPKSFHVDRWHDKYCEQVRRIFNQYKERHPAYKNKKLVIV